jgi:type II secretory pathway component GspD/PulD (secretin)
MSRYVKLLDQDSDYHSVSRPRMQCMSGETASISTGSRVAVPSSTLTTNFGGPSTSSNITYQNIALSLEVTPTLLPSGRISLLIKQTDNSISGTQVISGNTVPTIASQTFSTRTVVESGQLIALGGIRIDRNNATKKGPSGLAKVPLIGRLFRVDGGDSTKSELLILLSARVGSKHR